jgi:hypothetical protein
VIAGDKGRVAYAFLGSTTAGDPEQTAFKGYWYLYVALTYDGGATWTVQNLTPGDPVQRGCIYLAGTGDCPSPEKRNLYDFMDITADKDGRVLIGYADGCTGTCVTQQTQPCDDAACSTGNTKSTDHYASIARMTCGRGLIAAQDSALSCSTTTPTTTSNTPQVSTAPTASIPNTKSATPGAALPSATALAALLGTAWWRRRTRGRTGSTDIL